MEELGRQGREGSGTPGDKRRGEEPPEIVVKEVAECGNGKGVKNASTNDIETRGGKVKLARSFMAAQEGTSYAKMGQSGKFLNRLMLLQSMYFCVFLVVKSSL